MKEFDSRTGNLLVGWAAKIYQLLIDFSTSQLEI